jgi:surface antigen
VTGVSRTRVALLVLFFAAFLVPSTPAQATYSVLCTGYSTCSDKGFSHSGYSSHKGTSYWNMYTGTNCTNYVAYRLVTTNGLPNKRPKPGVGNARDWGTAMASVTNSTPTVGSVAWWGKTGNHVAYVEKVVSSTEILVSESNWSGAFDWRRITKSGSGWPDGFIHFSDLSIANKTKPSINGTPTVGVALKASGGVWEPKGNDYQYQWLADGKAVSGATSKTFTPTASLATKDLTVKVTAKRQSYPTATATSAAKEVERGTIKPTSPPSVAGTPQVDEPLTAAPGVWSPAATTTYQWLVDGTAVDGATSATFRPGPETAGKSVAVRVRANKGGYHPTTETSAKTAPVADGSLAATARPVVTGTPRVGSALSATTGTWSRTGLAYAYQWYVDGEAVNGATTSTYVPRARDVELPISVRVTARREGYETATSVSTRTAAVGRGTLAVRKVPTISGTPRVGSTLTATAGTWSAAATYSFQWYLNSTPIAGATAASYAPTRKQLDGKLRVRVTARLDGYTTAWSLSARTAAVTRGHIKVSTAPTVTGSPLLDQVVRVARGAYSPTGASLTYQWLRDGRTISGATSSSRRVKSRDLGHRLSVRITLRASGYTGRTVTTTETVKARAASTTRVSATPGRGKVTFVIRVSASGVPAPDGTVTVRYGNSRTRTVTIRDGRGTLALSGLGKGSSTYRFTFGATSTVASSTVDKTVTIG